MRLMHELPYWEKACFITLTYDEEHSDEQLHKTDIQNYFRELRRTRKIKYLSCGEYGETTGRPHYHAIIFGYDQAPHKQHIKDQDNIWTKGNIYLGAVTDNSTRYVCDYIFKCYDGKYGEDYYKGFTKPFRLLSKGIGKRYLEDNTTTIIQHGFIKHKGIRNSIPRYYLKRLDLTSVGLNEIVRTMGYVEEDNLHEIDGEIYVPLENRLQNERTLISRHRLKGHTL